MIRLLAIAALLAAQPSSAAPTPVEITAPGPQGPLTGALLDPDAKAPLVLIIPGSGPTDRDGNSPLGVAGGPYRQLAEALAAKGIATLRIDKRGLFGSRAAVADPNAATTGGYADDVQAWSKVARARTGRKCIWLAGHSEGGMVALVAAQRPEGLCGIILLSAVGRPMATVLRDQLRANPANAPILGDALGAIDALEAGKRVPQATLPAPLRGLFSDAIQGYWIDLFAHDPVKLIASVKLPVLILQGTRDIQVSVADAEGLKRAQPKATLILLPGVNHVLRPVASDDRMANIATYANATLPISPDVAAAVAGFVKP
ncbi:alpha/beta hydrolase [Sphingomonas psychrolutea]|uniref:Alpha/beta hydrolase n=1 Tax=Sphingomonas psychrolutea TaxID=1259676 RepID=A0ABQ1GMS5_9SPHN|nr:alpha/beta fold hydrolase [Sphingomonas psychrolutea]GGA46515.1 alpha/beta hydrolase [Sphingomonas psychrolutea]